MAGIARFHELIAGHAAGGEEPGQVVVGIETDRGPWVTALVASGYRLRVYESQERNAAGDGHAVA